MLYQLSYAPGLRVECTAEERCGSEHWHYPADVHRRALGFLFALLATGLALIALSRRSRAAARG